MAERKAMNWKNKLFWLVLGVLVAVLVCAVIFVVMVKQALP